MKYLELFILWVFGFILALVIGFLDYKITSFWQLLKAENLPAIIIYSLILSPLYGISYFVLQKKGFSYFSGVVFICSLVVGWLVWNFTSHAETVGGQVRNYLLITGTVVLIFAIPVTLFQWMINLYRKHHV